ncbi:hypothetical protein [Haloarcula amylovorans]|uniref:hypothetical protein n=1 Tax=Haloarcula amylovorans TaxID=2562280 RepID=UPI001075F13C|nr:hypothetical protein [Halomicroarcula amylolytica]
MTRQLTVVERFEHGTLIEAKSHATCADQEFTHAYYVPDKARRRAGMEQVAQMESAEEFHDEDGNPDFEAIESLISTADIVERAESAILNRTDGDIGTRGRFSPGCHVQSGQSFDENSWIPAGVVKFRDPSADDEPTIFRDPLKRGYCWGVLRDHVLPARHVHCFRYQNDVQQTTPINAQVPMSIIREGNEAIIAYLAAHDHSAELVGPYLGLEPERVRTLIERHVKAE